MTTLRCTALTLLGLLAAGASGREDDAPQNSDAEVKKLTGVWTCTRHTRDGEEVDKDVAGGFVLTIEADKMTSERLGLAFTFTYQIDPSKTPKEIDRYLDTDYEKARVTRGIYKVDGDTLTLCFAPSRKDRPTEFASKPGSGAMLFVYKRQTP